MLSIFTMPKPFRGHSDIIQRNAIRSWLMLRPACEVILLGDEAGTGELAAELGIRHIPEVERNAYGTPLVSSVFDIGQNAGSHRLVCYVNADIVLLSDFLAAVKPVQRESYLLIGRRWDLDLNDELDFSEPAWEQHLLSRLASGGKLHGPWGLDYFLFPRGLYRDIPPFAIGRGAWDNWLVYRARSLGIPVIDVTRAVTAIHQNHDYSHHPGGDSGIWKGPETDENRRLRGGSERAFGVYHSTHILTKQRVKRALTLEHLCYRISAIPAFHPHLRFLNPAIKILPKGLVVTRKLLKFSERR
jgi:hypothetical protein